VLVGGCNDPLGNVFVELDDYPGFYCTLLTKEVSVFYPETETFGTLAEMPEERTRHTAVAVDEKLYVIGGRGDDFDNLVKDVVVFDPETQKWTTYITLDDDHATSDHGSVVRDGKIYVFGGWKGDYSGPKETTFSIDTRNNGKIEDLTPMITKRGDIAAVHYKHGSIDAAFVIGGFGDEFCAPLDTVERYNFDSDSWTESTSDDLDLGSARGDKVAAVVDKKIFVVGGEDKHEDLCLEVNNLEPSVAAQAVDSVEVLDPLEKSPKWKNEADFPVERFRAASALDEKSNKLYVFGGQKAYSNDCDCYKTADEIYVHEGEQRGGGLSTTATALIATASVLAVVGSALFFFRRRNQKE